ncbi:PhoX family phosphatase [Glycomyces sp. TRM65418]|uniref:PhoX family protein n=1 Tax=Glycomyces sp. TRM65418 TaxID=2867006 RepID=UPI001CE68A7C|nr:PhoX family phosphatase [Glycomyces sp. TRM65418]MCC3765123.1 PhoX family phosphatase [Glycomyces sp. TRM65418]QZD54752.1 PhoX family phosphatase [Glycomyces sp. TRM65418]
MNPRDAAKRLRLPLLNDYQGGRSAKTCLYRCGDACSHPVPNTSDNPYLGDLIAQAVSRRSLFKAGAVVTVGAGAAGALGAPAAASQSEREASAFWGSTPRGLRFDAVEPNREDAVTIPDGYEQQIVIRWGDPILDDVAEFDPEALTPEDAAGQFGYNCDFLALLDLPGEHRRKVLVANHEYTSEDMMFYGYDAAAPTREQVEIGWASHGMSVVVLKEDKRSGALTPEVGHELNRRITATSEFVISGPAAGSDLLKTAADPEGTLALGTLNNCAGGVTPWGTVLSGEENFNQYFANAGQVADPVAKARLARYGLSGNATGRKWEQYDPRFDVLQEPNEPNRFGWIVELDPYDPDWKPRKRTALGRFKHEGAGPFVDRTGRVVVYMGDDERFDYMYKFVSKHKMKSGNSRRAREHNRTLLDEGTLYVAKFTGDSADEIDGSGALPSDGQFDGWGEWIKLASGDRSFVDGMTAEEVYVFTREAGDKVGATKMDRPEDVEPNPRTGKVYAALTNNSQRGGAGRAAADEANPRNANKHGHVLELEEKRGDVTATRFGWKLLLVCGDPENADTYFAGFPKDQVSPISCPDNVAFDPQGNLWISTDGNALGTNDGLFGVSLSGRTRGMTKQFLTVPIGAETCGPVVQEKHILVAVQHPGEIDGASAETPASQWPDGPDGTLPRPSVVNVTKDRFGSIGC